MATETSKTREQELEVFAHCLTLGCGGEIVRKTSDSLESFSCMKCMAVYLQLPFPWLQERMTEREKDVIDAGHNFGPWVSHNEQVITASCQNDGCRAKTFLNTREGIHGAESFRRCPTS